MAKDLMDNKVLDDEQLSTVAGGNPGLKGMSFRVSCSMTQISKSIRRNTAVEMQQCRISSRTK